ncbi:MAG: cytochrome C oxidase subunit IV family protein [Actinomycetota bacterium]
MTTTVSSAAEHEVDETVHDHPSDAKYVKIAVILAAITALEVATYFWEGASTLGLVLVLFPMMIAKFAIVTGYFMHLKYDNPIFRRVFVFGLLLATAVFMITFFAFNYFDDSYLRFLRG